MHTSKPTLLIVDDEQPMERLFRAKFRKELRRGEMELFFAADGEEALQRLAENPQVNVIFSDLNMPGMDGITLLQQLKGQFNGPAIIITAYGDYDRLRLAINEGAFDFLSKPLDFEDLQRTLERALDAQRRTTELERENRTLKRTLVIANERILELETQVKELGNPLP